MQRVQTEKLQHKEEQEKYPGQVGTKQILPLLPKTYGSQ
jgi:hypothetical protein